MLPQMAMLLGGRSGVTVSISNTSVSDNELYPTAAEAAIEFTSTGTISTGGTWLIGSTTGSSYEARATIVSGSLSGGSDVTGSWLALSSNRTWLVSRSSFGTSTCVFDLEIGLAGASSALDTARITLSAAVEP